jgi:hypothetical protein
MSRTVRIGLLCGLLAAALPAGVARAACAGDCSGDGSVTINELVLGVGIATGATSLSACPAFDLDDSNTVTINELISAVNAALSGCPATPTPSSTPIDTATASHTPTLGATQTPVATATATAVDTGTATVTAVDSATATPSETPSPSTSPTDTVSPTPVDTATESVTPVATVTDTPGSTPSETMVATATDSPTVEPTANGDTPTSTPSATFTPTELPTSTPTMAAVCGNGFLEAGETCAGCPADCTVLACTPTPPIQTFRIDFHAPEGSNPSAVSALVGYRSNRVSLPGSMGMPGSRVKMRPSGTSQLVNDLNYAVRVLIQAQSGGSIPSGKLFTVDFDSCQGAVAESPADFGCTIESCGSSFGPIDGCSCTVTTP